MDRDDGFCGCTAGLCETRLITGVLWDLDDPPKDQPQGD